MTPRERVLCALDHQEPDRVPVFFGTSGVTSMLAPAYEQLKAALGIKGETRFISQVFQYARIDEDVLERFHSDGRALLAGPPPSPLRQPLVNDTLRDEWGITWRRNPATLYFESADAPLRTARAADLPHQPWPDLAHPSRFEHLAAEARALRSRGFAVVCLSGVCPFEQIQLLRGMETWLTDLASDPAFAHALLRRVTDLMLSGLSALLGAAGEWIDVLVMGDDLGTQNAPVISPAMYRQLLKPYHAELIAASRARSRARIFFHTDGNVFPLLDDLVEIGVDILNPVQVSARDMGDTARLKRRYGGQLSFCGGIDTQQVLPHGTTDDVRREVRRRLADLAPGGGYIAAPVHCIQPDVPLENVFALFDELAASGRYPLARHLSA